MKVTRRQVLAAFNDAGVRYLVVGGTAVVLHGSLRTTLDLDVVVQLQPDNVRRALGALAALGYRPRLPVTADQFADPETRAGWIADKGMRVFPLYSDANPLLTIDIFVREPFDFDAAYRRACHEDIDGTAVVVCSLEDLIRMKKEAGRHKDLADVEELERIRLARDAHDRRQEPGGLARHVADEDSDG